MRFLLPLLAMLVGLVGFVRPAFAGCEAGSANFTYTDGRPLLYETTKTYTNANCTGFDSVDVTYKALAGLPGTYLSWADIDATTEVACSASTLVGRVWDMTSSPPVYKGELRSTGTWVNNRDPISNPGAKVCHVPPIRFETMFGFTAGRKYRFAVRALRSNQKGGRDFVLANAPLPTLNSGCDSLDGTWYCALTTSSGATENHDRWPTASFRLKLEAPALKVAQGGDLFFQNGKFFQPSYTYPRSDRPNFGYSNAALVYKGNVASLSQFSCSDFTMLADTYATPDYSYLSQTTTSSTSAGSSYRSRWTCTASGC